MGAWGTGVFDNDTALDAMAEMSEIFLNYFIRLADSEDENAIMLSAFIFLATKDKDGAIEKFADLNCPHQIDLIANCLNHSDVEDYKYQIIGNLYRCLDCVNEWKEDCREARKAIVKQMIEEMTKSE